MPSHYETPADMQDIYDEDAQKYGPTDKLIKEGKLKEAAEQHPDRQTGLDLKAEIAGVGFETSVNVATDALTTALGWAPPLYAVVNFLSAGGANLVSQKIIRGKEDINWGEAWASAGMGTIPFMSPSAGRLTKFVGNPNSFKRVVIGGGLTGVGYQQIEAGVNEGRVISPTEAALGFATGGVVSGGMKAGSEALGKALLGNINARPVYAAGSTTPEKYRRKILANEPITAGKQPGDYTVFELDLATRGPGIEGQGMPYDAAMRRRVERVDYDLITELNLRYGGTREQAEEFLIYQKFAKKQVDEAVYNLNKKQRKLQIEDLKQQVSKGKIKLSNAELKKAIRKINNTTYYNLGHIRSAKNVWRYEKLFGANRASNMLPEIEPNIEVFNKVTGKRERIIVHGNKSRGARMDIPDEILQMTGTSATIDEEYLKFIDPTISEMSYELLPKKLQDELLGSVQEKWKRFRSAGYSDFADYLQEVEGLSWYQFNKLPKNRIKSKNAPITQNDLRVKFNAQTEIVPGTQQLDTWKPFLRQSVDDFIHAQELKKEWTKLKKAGKHEKAADLLLEIGKLIN